MNILALTQSALTCNPVITLPATTIRFAQPIQALSWDYGFDLDADQLGSWPAARAPRPLPLVGPGEFESRYCWFIS